MNIFISDLIEQSTMVGEEQIKRKPNRSMH
jgi:hypothetical protein